MPPSPTYAVPGTSTLSGPFGMNDPRIAALLGGIPRAAESPVNIAGDLAKFKTAAAGITSEPLTEVATPGRLSRLASSFGAGGALRAGGIGRAGLYGVGGVLAGQLADHLVGEHNNTSLDEGLTGALTGAGIGAGIGSFLPGAGTAIGAGLGFLGGGLVGLAGKKHTGQHAVDQELANQTTKITALARALGLPGDITSQLGAQLQILALNAGDDATVKSAGAQLAQSLPALAQSTQQQKVADLRAMAVQSAMTQFASPYLQEAATQTALTHQQSNDAADQIGGDTGKLLRQHAQQTRSNQDRLLAAYATQIAMTPQTQQYDTLSKLRNQANSQLYAKLAGQATSGVAGVAGGGNSNLTQQIAQLGQ